MSHPMMRVTVVIATVSYSLIKTLPGQLEGFRFHLYRLEGMIIDPVANSSTEPSSSPGEPLPDLPDYDTVIRSQPPRYIRNVRPRQPITYTFTDWISDSMLLLPPSAPGSPGRVPVYRVSASLNLNPFLPICYVTQICRAGLYAGQLVGQFEFSPNHRRGILTMGDVTTRISNIVSSINANPRHLKWDFQDAHLRWDCRTALDDGSPMCTCYARDTAMTQLASFVPPAPDASPPLPAALLTIFPDGHQDDLFDHIVVSALVIERKLTSAF